MASALLAGALACARARFAVGALRSPRGRRPRSRNGARRRPVPGVEGLAVATGVWLCGLVDAHVAAATRTPPGVLILATHLWLFAAGGWRGLGGARRASSGSCRCCDRRPLRLRARPRPDRPRLGLGAGGGLRLRALDDAAGRRAAGGAGRRDPGPARPPPARRASAGGAPIRTRGPRRLRRSGLARRHRIGAAAMTTAARSRCGRALRALSTALIICGTLLLADAGATLLWQEPVSALYARFQQGELQGQLDRLDRRQADPGRAAGAEEAPRPAAAARLRRPRARSQDRRRRRGRQDPDRPDRALVGDRRGHERRRSALRARATTRTRRCRASAAPSASPGTARPTARPFARSTRSSPGDEIVIVMPYGRFTYRVERTRIVQPTAVWVTNACPTIG